jgi:hypothetical protein
MKRLFIFGIHIIVFRFSVYHRRRLVQRTRDHLQALKNVLDVRATCPAAVQHPPQRIRRFRPSKRAFPFYYLQQNFVGWQSEDLAAMFSLPKVRIPASVRYFSGVVVAKRDIESPWESCIMGRRSYITIYCHSGLASGRPQCQSQLTDLR